jgi:hypothetical protein
MQQKNLSLITHSRQALTTICQVLDDTSAVLLDISRATRSAYSESESTPSESSSDSNRGSRMGLARRASRRYGSRSSQEPKRTWSVLAENASSTPDNSTFALGGLGATDSVDELVRRVVKSDSVWYNDSSDEADPRRQILQSISPGAGCMLALPVAQARHSLLLILSWSDAPTRPGDTADFASDLISSLVAALAAKDSRHTERAQLTFSNVQAQ